MAAPLTSAVERAARGLTGDIVVIRGKVYRRVKVRKPTGKRTPTGRAQTRTTTDLVPVDVDLHVNPASIGAGAAMGLVGLGIGAWMLGIGVHVLTDGERRDLQLAIDNYEVGLVKIADFRETVETMRTQHFDDFEAQTEDARKYRERLLETAAQEWEICRQRCRGDMGCRAACDAEYERQKAHAQSEYDAMIHIAKETLDTELAEERTITFDLIPEEFPETGLLSLFWRALNSLKKDYVGSYADILAAIGMDTKMLEDGIKALRRRAGIPLSIENRGRFTVDLAPG